MIPIKISEGVGEYHVKNWREFVEMFADRVDHATYIWRGQRKLSWKLESTLDRLIEKLSIAPHEIGPFVKDHLECFQYATRGRRGALYRQIKDIPEDEWWALGQHFGLATPLLDWTASPYVALFFAFAKENEDDQNEHRVIFGLGTNSVLTKSTELLDEWKRQHSFLLNKGKKDEAGKLRQPNTITVQKPLVDENPRLVAQGGLFTKSPIGLELEAWVRRHYRHETKKCRLFKITMADSERETVLKALNRMNINHLSLFPDIFGASLYSNLVAKIPSYSTSM